MKDEARVDARSRDLPAQLDVTSARPDRGGGAATPSFRLPDGASLGLPADPVSTVIGGQQVRWGLRTLVMGIVNVTPDSFSGDGLLASGGDPVSAAREQALRMAGDGADILDIGGESTRPGHERVSAAEEFRRVVPVIRAIHEALPDLPLSVDTTRAEVAAAALDAGASLLNDIWGVTPDDGMLLLAAGREAPLVLMHNRAEARYRNVVAEVLAELERAAERAVRAGVHPSSIILDPGFGFGKTPAQNLALLRALPVLRSLGFPILVGTSRKSTLGRVLDLPAGERLEATLATTALAIAGGADIVRVHDVRENARAARMADAVVRGWTDQETPGASA
jgi:dihydropteroate synthase